MYTYNLSYITGAHRKVYKNIGEIFRRTRIKVDSAITLKIENVLCDVSLISIDNCNNQICLVLDQNTSINKQNEQLI